MKLRTTSLSVLAMLTLPAAATAAVPPTVTGPTAASLRAKPSFSWTNGPVGEHVTSISIGPKADVAADGSLASTAGGGLVLSSLDGRTSTMTPRPLHAGTWHWTASWSTAADAAMPETGNTTVQSFVVPVYLRTLQGRFLQNTGTTAFLATGSFATNVRAASATCSVFDGRTRISTQLDPLRPVIGRRTSFTCSGLRVPERLDGKLLRLVVVARAGGVVQRAVQRFRAT